MVNERRERLFRRKDVKYLIYLLTRRPQRRKHVPIQRRRLHIRQGELKPRKSDLLFEKWMESEQRAA